MSFTPGSKRGEMADINMTPMIDVMLVLLIIFMVAAPMLTTGVDVSLPESRTGKNLESEALTVSLALDGRIQFGAKTVREAELKSELKSAADASRKRPILVRADHNIPYGRIIAVVDLIREAGFTQVGFVTAGTILPAPDAGDVK